MADFQDLMKKMAESEQLKVQGGESEEREVTIKAKEDEEVDQHSEQEGEDQDVEDHLEDNDEDEEQRDTEQEDEEIDEEFEDDESDTDTDEDGGGEEEEYGDEDDEYSGEEGEEQEEEGESQNANEEKIDFNAYEYTDGVFETEQDLKSHVDLLKENPELVSMLEYFREEGTLLPYLQATQIDVDSYSDIDILKMQYQSENKDSGLAEDEIDILFEDEVLSGFQFDEDMYDEEELNKRKRVAAVKLKRQADKVRKELKEEQERLKLPTHRDGVEKQQSEEKARALESEKNKLAYTIRKQVSKENKMEIEVEKGNSVTLKVSPKKISSLLEKTSDTSLFKDDEGNFDIKKMAILSDVDSFVKGVVNNSKAKGKQEFIQNDLKGRKPKNKALKGQGKPKVQEKLDPRDIRSFKGAKITTF